MNTNEFRITLLGLFLLSSCATTEAQFAPALENQNFSSRTPSDKIELFRSQSPSKKFIEIGAVNSCCSGDSNLLIDELRKKASSVGGDAIIGLDITAVGGASASVIRYQ